MSSGNKYDINNIDYSKSISTDNYLVVPVTGSSKTLKLPTKYLDATKIRFGENIEKSCTDTARNQEIE